MEATIKHATEILKNGGIAIFPTDTACGIGCRIDNENAVERLFSIKGRSTMKATPVLVNSIEMLRAYSREIHDDVLKILLNPYWPGALTVVLHCKTEKIPPLVRGNADTVGFRMPDSALVLEIITRLGVPLIGTSANFAGGPTPFDTNDVEERLKEQADVTISGKCPLRQSSTVIDVTKTPWEIIRQGAVHLDAKFGIHVADKYKWQQSS